MQEQKSNVCARSIFFVFIRSFVVIVAVVVGLNVPVNAYRNKKKLAMKIQDNQKRISPSIQTLMKNSG